MTLPLTMTQNHQNYAQIPSDVSDSDFNEEIETQYASKNNNYIDFPLSFNRDQTHQSRSEFSQSMSRYQGQECQQSELSVLQNEKINDTFLQTVEQHLKQIKKQREIGEQMSKISQELSRTTFDEVVRVSDPKIQKNLLVDQTCPQEIKITSLVSIILKIKISNFPFPFSVKNVRNKFLKGQIIELELQPFQTMVLCFDICRRQGEFGNIYETAIIQFTQEHQAFQKMLEFQINFCKPIFSLEFLGTTQVKRIYEQKFAHIRLYPNDKGEYILKLTSKDSQDFKNKYQKCQIEKITCQIEARGSCSVYPNTSVLYLNDCLTLRLKQKSNRNLKISPNNKTALIIKLLNSSLCYILSVQCIRKDQSIPYSKNQEVYTSTMRL